VIDAGSLQVMDTDWIPKNSILTPNIKEFELLFKCKPNLENANLMAKKFNCIIVLKGSETIISQSDKYILVSGGNAGLTKGGTGDCLAGLTVGLLAKNDAFLAASSASFIIKKSAETLFENVGVNYNSDDLSDEIPRTFVKLTK
jgi:NAD(P)H-hydrate epimerase